MFYVKRTRLRDRPSEMMLGRESRVGEVLFSRTFPTLRGAELEAASWDGPSWRCEIIPGKRPES